LRREEARIGKLTTPFILVGPNQLGHRLLQLSTDPEFVVESGWERKKGTSARRGDEESGKEEERT